jgi:hypothetical protein
MVSTTKTSECQLIENNRCYREVRVSTEHFPYGHPGISELFAHIPHGQGNIVLTRVSTSVNPQRFVLSNKELFDLVAQAADYLHWQESRQQARTEVQTLLEKYAEWDLKCHESNDGSDLYTLYRMEWNEQTGRNVDRVFAENVPMDGLSIEIESAVAALASSRAKETRLCFKPALEY